PLPARLTLKSANVATPLAAVAVVVPPSVPPLELAARATVTFSAKPAATLPSVSKAVTWTGGVSTLSTMAPCGCAVNASRAAAAGRVHRAHADGGGQRLARGRVGGRRELEPGRRRIRRPAVLEQLVDLAAHEPAEGQDARAEARPPRVTEAHLHQQLQSAIAAPAPRDTSRPPFPCPP